MNHKELEAYLNGAKAYVKAISSGVIKPEKSLASLVEAGIYDRDGKLTPPYAGRK